MKKRKLNVLVACESSATVRDAFRALGHNAWSCDLLPCDGDPRYHYQGDVLQVLTATKLMSRLTGTTLPKKWDLIIGHPPCTYLCNSGVRWLFENPTWRGGVPTTPLSRWGRPYGEKQSRSILLTRNANEDRYEAMLEAAKLFGKLWNADIPHTALENPIMHGYAAGEIFVRGVVPPKPAQIVQPWQFGHGETKATGLYLKNLPKLVPTDIVEGREHRIHKMAPSKDRWKLRSKTFQGIADAMASQWSAYILNEDRHGVFR